MKLNLSSQIVLNKVPEQYYRPRTAVERSELTRCEKVFTDIYPKVEPLAPAFRSLPSTASLYAVTRSAD